MFSAKIFMKYGIWAQPAPPSPRKAYVFSGKIDDTKKIKTTITFLVLNIKPP